MPEDEVQAGGNVPALTLLGARFVLAAFAFVGGLMTYATARSRDASDPGGSLGILALVAAIPLLGFAALLKVESERRKPAPRFRLTPEGLVRVRGDEVRTLPWGTFVDATPIMTSKRRGNVHLRHDHYGRRAIWLHAREGRVWTFVNGLVIVDVEDPRGLAARIQPYLARRTP